MKNKYPYVFAGLTAGLFLVAGCATKNGNMEEADCPPKACTMEFRSIGVLFKNSAGDTLTVSNYAVLNKRNGEKLPSGSTEADGNHNAPYYLVADDGDKASLTVEGDTLAISALNPQTKQVGDFEMVVAGGRCECHISKVAGEEVLVFEE